VKLINKEIEELIVEYRQTEIEKGHWQFDSGRKNIFNRRGMN
jgi:hypothetical protein